MARRLAFARAFAGRWRITLVDTCPDDALGVAGEAHLTFTGTDDGEIAFIALRGFLDVRYGSHDCVATAEFSFEDDDGDPISGRGLTSLGTAGRPVGHIYIHKGKESAFVCERWCLLQQPASCGIRGGCSSELMA